jgi:hypothetical protein
MTCKTTENIYIETESKVVFEAMPPKLMQA